MVVFSVDDYGNVRLDSQKARNALDDAGLKTLNRYDAYDSLETREDLEMLFEVLSSVKDSNGRNTVFTPFSIPCNIDFEKMADENYSQYRYELLPQTFAKLAAYEKVHYDGAWQLWKEGISKGLLVPQFHGREHFNLRVFEKKLKEKDEEVLIVLKNRSYTSLSYPGYHNIGYTSAFGFWEFEENLGFESIIEDGLNAFEKVYGYRSVHFTPPAGSEHHIIHSYSKKNGIKYIDTPLIKREHQGLGKYRTIANYTGKRNTDQITYMVRNVVFEPTENHGIEWVNIAMRQIEAAFRWNRPAIISSHRVNFCGHIDPQNRKTGLTALKELLTRITTKWPDVEFMSADQLGDLITKRK